MQTTSQSIIIDIALAHYPVTQGIYLFGSYGTENEWPASDVDIALLLPHAQALDEFEMMVISYYQKLNEERREILEAFFRTGRAYRV